MLRENRYLDKIGMPDVRSQAELVAPAIAVQSVDFERKTLFTKDQESITGRCINATACLVAKDVIRADANNSIEANGYVDCHSFMFQN